MAHLTNLRTSTKAHVLLLALLLLGISASPAFATPAIQLTWEASPDPDLLGYHVYMGTSPGSYPTIKDAGLTQSFLFQNLAEGQSYYFMVTAYDQMRNESMPSDEVSVEIPDTTPPSIPANVTLASSSNTEVSMQWTPATDNVGVTAYDVARDGAVIGLSQTNTFLDRAITAGSTYLYTVRAVDAMGNTSAWSTPLQLVVASQDTSSPSVPQNLTLNSTSDTQVSFSWTASTDNVGVTGYDVARDNVVVGQSTTSAFVDRTTRPGTIYAYTVQAMDANENRSAWSTPLQVTTPQTLAQLTVSTSGNGSITSTPNGINCPKQYCTDTYPPGTVVTLSATPGKGWSFVGWVGGCTGTDACTLTLTGNMTLNASFSKGSTSGSDGGSNKGGGSNNGGGKGPKK